MKRQKLIEVILDLAGDEYEDRLNLIGLAEKSEEELIDDIISIAKWYSKEYNKL